MAYDLLPRTLFKEVTDKLADAITARLVRGVPKLKCAETSRCQPRKLRSGWLRRRIQKRIDDAQPVFNDLPVLHVFRV